MPNWLIFASLLMTGVLYLSEQFRWFAFNRQNGWTVLIRTTSNVEVHQ
jgi:hypothetical protein